ncbi:MAG: NHLP family bacteriocin export ABC transporter peptidase/permease/ATPase subunit [Oscillospiraceae bacterium]|nr:NHLP family bacteriocin export ABC transporter peptidase/permease/ATPase subunit [Oscillospiraceae bacterium]
MSKKARPVTKGRAKVPVVMQMEALECGAACLTMILAYYGKWVPLEQIRVDCGVSRDGSNAMNMVMAAEDHGLKATGFRCGLKQLRENAAFPCIIHWNFNHFVVLCGFKGKHAYINDPARGSLKISLDELDKSFTGIYLEFMPTEKFKPGGKRKSTLEFAAKRLEGTSAAVSFVVLTTLIGLLFDLVNPAFSRFFMDRLLTGENTELLRPFVLILAAVGIMEVIVISLRVVFSLKINGKMDATGSSIFLWKVLRLPTEFFGQRLTGDILLRQNTNATIAETLVQTLVPLVLHLIMLIFYLVIMFRYSVVLTLVGVSAVFMNLFLSQIISKKRVNITRVQQRDTGRLVSTAVSGIRMVETIKSNGAENGFFQRWAGYQASVNAQEVSYSRLNQRLGMIPPLLTSLANASVLVIGVWLTLHGKFTVGMILTFQGFMSAFMRPASNVVSARQTIQEMRTDMERVEDVMEYPDDPLCREGQLTGDIDYSKLSGEVELKNVSFGYSRLGRPLIEDFSVHIKPGSCVALVGASGSGKSTVAKLISGLYSPWSGEILFDGKPVSEIERTVFTGSVAVVDQDSMLFEDTVANNIKMWNDTIQDFEMILAARDAHIYDDIMDRDGGFDGMISEDGRDLSGGQKQRIEIARVLAQDPTILIMDEATSSLDAKTEFDVVSAVKARGVTCIIIAHRLSTIRDCDEIIVLNKGRIVERGTHDELYAMGGFYTALISNDGGDLKMGWFDEQIRQSLQNDQELFEESLLRMASVVMGKKPEDVGSERIITKAAIDEILKYYNFKPAEIPNSIKDADERLEYCLRPHGIMRRNVKLTEVWYKDCTGPILAFNKETGDTLALLPGKYSGYFFYDREAGKNRKLDKRTAEQLDEDATVFYRPLPQKEVGRIDMIRYLMKGVSHSDIVFLIILTLLVTGAGILLPMVTRFLTGYVLDTGATGAFAGTVIFLTCTLAATAVLNAVKNLAVTRMKIKTSIPLSAAIMARMINLPASFFRDYSAGDLASRFHSLNQMCTYLVEYIFTGGLTVLLSLLYIGQIAHYASGMIIPALLVLLLLSGMGGIALSMRRKVNKRIMHSNAENSGLTYDLISGVQKIRLAGAEKRAFSLWGNSYSVKLNSKYNIPSYLKVHKALEAAVTLAGTVAFYCIAVKQCVSPSAYMAFSAAYGTVIAAFKAMDDMTPAAAMVGPIYDMIEPVLKTVPETSDSRETVTSLTGSIELSNVYFRYKENTPYVVDGMSLKIKAGEYVAIVGTTGCGKSTIMRLLLGFEKPEKGAIYYDRKNMAKLDHRSLRRRIGTVMQDSSLFSGDIYSNIVISAPHLGVDAAWEAAETAGIADDIREMPMPMHTFISEGQGGISGGQKQRLLIARAVASKPRILMFDEATSALDNKTQKAISEALDRMQCTRIVIAHRLSTIKNCDRILMIDKGKIVESGTYEELLARNGRFAELVKRQRLD